MGFLTALFIFLAGAFCEKHFGEELREFGRKCGEKIGLYF